MIKHLCPICKKIWYCKADDRCETEWERQEKPLGGCICSGCSCNISIDFDSKCEVVKYEVEWRIA